jgi:hypothetical protein
MILACSFVAAQIMTSAPETCSAISEYKAIEAEAKLDLPFFLATPTSAVLAT